MKFVAIMRTPTLFTSAILSLLLVLAGATSCDNPGTIESGPHIDLPPADNDTASGDTIDTEFDNDTEADGDSISTGDSTDTGGPVIAEALTISGALQLYYPDEARGIALCGYIVGTVNSTSISGATFNAPFRSSNLLLADSPTENDPARCIPVELKANSLARQQYNLVDNPQMLHQKIILTGSLERYFRVAGLKNAKIPVAN